MTNVNWPDAVLFDWDGTLIDSWPLIHEAWCVTVKKMGHDEEWTFQKTKDHARRALKDTFPHYFGDRWEEAMEIYYAHFRAHHLNQLAMLDGADSLLEKFKSLDVPMAVVSNKWGEMLRKEVSKLGWEDYFFAVVGAGDASANKPHPDPVHLAMEKVNISLDDEIWFIGDTEIDMQVAHATGCLPVWIGDLPADGFNGNGPKINFDDCHALHAHVMGMTKQI